MTNDYEELRNHPLLLSLRQRLMIAGYPEIYRVSNEELELAERYLEAWLIDKGMPPILRCGKHGLYFKGVQLVLEA